MNDAHEGVIRDPSLDPTQCLSCHKNPVGDLAAVNEDNYRNSLHVNQWGYIELFEERCGCPIDPYLGGFQANCATCHSTCGECHVSRPRSVGGGFLRVTDNRSTRHKFRKTPHMTEQCTACHGSRIGHDYFGDAEGNLADVHWGSHLQQCGACHSATEIHGDGLYPAGQDHYEHRYEVTSMPSCDSADCHADDASANSYHSIHWSGSGTTLSCQACHSQSYKNCSNCHAGGESDPSVLTFKIGKNPIPSERRPYDFVVLRHIPVVESTYENWGLASLDNFDAVPTWKYSSPHNIRRLTDRTSLDGETPSCGACHCWEDNEMEDPFLRLEDLEEGDSEANLDLTVEAGSPPCF
jgi:thiosulfate/3-mercaptopyruvate sulfurtransferase